MTKVASLTPLAAGFITSGTLNDKLERIEEAFQNTLSRDGSSPNQMEADLDMNTKRILNLPAPSTAAEPLRKADLDVIIAAPPTAGTAITTSVSDTNEYFTAENVEAVLQEIGQVRVDTIAALKALSAPTGKVKAIVLGYYAAGDGGGGDFYFDSASAAADNGGTVIAPNAGSGRWIRLHQSIINARWFGANPSQSGGTNKTAIQAANNYLNGLGGGIIKLPAGSYDLAGDIGLSADVTIEGDGIGRTVVTETGTSGDHMFVIDSVDNAGVVGMTLNGLNGNCIYIRCTTANTQYPWIEDIYVASLGTSGKGIYFETTPTTTIYFPFMKNVSVQGGGAAAWGTKIGVQFGTTGGIIVVGPRWLGGRIWRCDQGVRLEKCDTAKAHGIALDDCQTVGIHFVAAENCNFIGTRFEPLTFGKCVIFNSAANLCSVDGLPDNAATSDITDPYLTDVASGLYSGGHNSYYGANGSGGLLSRESEKRRYSRTQQFDRGFMGIELPSATAVGNVPIWDLGRLSRNTASGGSAGASTHRFPFVSNALYMAVVQARSNTDSAKRATRVAYFSEIASGSFVEHSVVDAKVTITTCTIALARSGDNITMTVTTTGGFAGETAFETRNLIKVC